MEYLIIAIIKKVFDESVVDRIRNISIRESYSFYDVSVTYGMYGLDNVIITISKTPLEVFRVDGKIKLYDLLKIDEGLKDLQNKL